MERFAPPQNRTFTLRAPLRLSWQQVYQQFGADPAKASDNNSVQNFRRKEGTDGFEARRLIDEWIGFYNTERPHSALDGKTLLEAYRGDPPVDMMDKPLRALPTSPQAQQQRQEDLSKKILAV